MWMYEIVCKDCKQQQRWEFEITVNDMIPHFCGSCGSSNIEQRKFDQYWYDLAQDFGFERSAKGAALIKGLFDLWDRNEHKRFRDFVKEVTAESNLI